MLIKEVHQKSVIFVTIVFLMMSLNLSDIAILKINGSDYGCKSEAIKLLQNIYLNQKSGTL